MPDQAVQAAADLIADGWVSWPDDPERSLPMAGCHLYRIW
jgi:hypothetical protein